MQSKEIGEPLMKQTLYGCRVEGIDVVMTIGEKACRMDHRTAVRLAAFLRHAGRLAKQAAGEGGSIWTPMADLTDGNLEEAKAQASRDRTAVFGKV